jgi:hypothetical protein
VTTKQANGARTYLHVMPRYAADPQWHVYQISDQSPRITFAESVTSYVDAHELAARDQRPLRIAEQAWQQMLDAGVAPPDKTRRRHPRLNAPRRSSTPVLNVSGIRR